MKRFLSGVLVAILPVLLVAQEEVDYKLSAGGFGHGYAGPAFLKMENLNQYLESALGNNYYSVTVGAMVGGEGFWVTRQMLIGGGGFGIVLPRVSADSASSQTGIGAGYFKLGYFLEHTPKGMGYVSGALGAGGMTIRVDNPYPGKTIQFSSVPVKGNQSAKYSIPVLYFELGAGWKWFNPGKGETGKSHGGFLFGVDGGLCITIPTGDWKRSDHDGKIGGIPTPDSAFSPFIRITLGGGWFK